MASDRNDKVQLGCGTLILIALIVIIFSGGGGSGRGTQQIEKLQRDVRRLEMKIDTLTQTIETFQSNLTRNATTNSTPHAESSEEWAPVVQ